jgi:hypothetical protein
MLHIKRARELAAAARGVGRGERERKREMLYVRCIYIGLCSSIIIMISSYEAVLH